MHCGEARVHKEVEVMLHHLTYYTVQLTAKHNGTHNCAVNIPPSYCKREDAHYGNRVFRLRFRSLRLSSSTLQEKLNRDRTKVNM